MARKRLCAETFTDFDSGKPAAMWDHAIATAVRDVKDRSGDKTKRVVQLTAEITPRFEQDGDLEDVEIVFHCTCKLPAWRCASRPLAVARGNGGELIFSEDAPDNPYQTTAFDEEADDE